MPTYEYRCKDCDRTLEVVQAFTDDALTVCPHCSGPLRKIFGNVGITFKGSGFYKTDSRTKPKAGAAAKANGESGGDSKESSGGGSGDKASGDKASSDKASSDKSSSSSDSGSKSSSSGGSSGSGDSGKAASSSSKDS